MRIYNGTNSQLDLPLSGIQRISIAPHAVSGDVLPSTEFLSLMVTSFDYNEIALIVSGPYEINMCANVSGCAGFIAQSLEEAIERFTKKEEIVEVDGINKPEVKEEKACKEEKTEKKVEPVVKEENTEKVEVKIEEIKVEEKEEDSAKKSPKKAKKASK